MSARGRTLSWRWIFPWLWALGLLPGAGLGAERAPQKRFALVVGWNGGDGSMKPLRYADDDALENAALLAQLGAEVTLLTALDDQSRALHPGFAARAPTRENLEAAWNALDAEIARADRDGYATVFYFFYSGHGNVEHNQGYVQLSQGRLWRKDLLLRLARSGAVANHVVIDACKSYFMVFNRGVGGDRRAVVGALTVDEERLPDNTGVLLSTSSAEDSHEWEAYQGGIFGHELRSALRGGADLDGDGLITYPEASSFIWAANAAIPNERYRPAFFAWRPERRASAALGLVSLRGAAGDLLRLGPGVDRHVYVESGVGVRVLDVHPGKDQRLALLLPVARPLFVHDAQLDREWSLPPGGEIELAALTPQKRRIAARGAEHEAFTTLFSKPFDALAVQSFQEELRASRALAPAKPLSPWWRRSLGLASPVLGVLGGTFYLLAQVERGKLTARTSGSEAQAIADRVSVREGVGLGLFIGAGAALVGYTVWTLFFEEKKTQYYFSNLFGPGNQTP